MPKRRLPKDAEQALKNKPHKAVKRALCGFALRNHIGFINKQTNSAIKSYAFLFTFRNMCGIIYSEEVNSLKKFITALICMFALTALFTYNNNTDSLYLPACAESSSSDSYDETSEEPTSKAPVIITVIAVFTITAAAVSVLTYKKQMKSIKEKYLSQENSTDNSEHRF